MNLLMGVSIMDYRSRFSILKYLNKYTSNKQNVEPTNTNLIILPSSLLITATDKQYLLT